MGFSGEINFRPVPFRAEPFDSSHRVYSGEIEIGAALELAPVEGKKHLRVSLNVPEFPVPIVAALEEGEDTATYKLVWHRPGAARMSEVA
jgi:uncharacterized protein (DUF736 family)